MNYVNFIEIHKKEELGASENSTNKQSIVSNIVLIYLSVGLQQAQEQFLKVRVSGFRKN
jgi:hypothetical protein